MILENPKTETKIRGKATPVRSTGAPPACKAFTRDFMPPRGRMPLDAINEADG